MAFMDEQQNCHQVVSREMLQWHASMHMPAMKETSPMVPQKHAHLATRHIALC